MNEFDQFVKHILKVKQYARYTDDFVILGPDKAHLLELLPHIKSFLGTKLKLSLHPQKVSVRSLPQGIDFLGYVVLPHHIVPRTRTKRRIFRKTKQKIEAFCSGKVLAETLNGALNSYDGMLGHANAKKLREKLWNSVWFWSNQ